MQTLPYQLVKGCLTLTLIIFLSIISSCIKDKIEPINGIDGLDGFNALVDIVTEPSGDNCSTGGIKISIGQDVNENGILDQSEIESISFICNGSTGTDGQSPADLLAQTAPEQPGDNCEYGGTRIEIGNDTNNNKSLDAEEVVSSFFICNGNDGTNGSNGNDGADGSDGTNGNDGLHSIIRATAESSGENCSSGGLKIEIGLDSNDNSELDTEEIQSTYYICNGANGKDGADGADGNDGTNGSNGINTLSNVITEPAGANCPNGGYKLEVGLDSNNNGTLDDGEVSSENYICNGNDGTNGNDGFSSLIRISTELPGENCSDGGMKIEVGLDDVTQNGMLDAEEVDFTQYVCDGLNGGENGLNTIIQTVTEAPGENCANGGVRIQVGLDANTNNELDLGEEIGGAFYVCNGLDGSNGADGLDGLDGQDVIVISTPSTSCENGGSTLAFGHDGNNDGDLADTEDTLLTSITICNGIDGSNGADGADGYNTIIVTNIEGPGVNCVNGGLSISIGLDINRNNSIDNGEEIDTYYVCNGSDGANGSNGTDGQNVIVTSTAATSCSGGGVTLAFGYDGNADGDLEDPEDSILASSTICNGTNGADGSNGYNTIISTKTEDPGDNCPNGGIEFTVGLDTNSNNAIDAGEEVGTYYACNGEDGNDGANGSDGRDLIVTSSAAASCSNGGLTLAFGYDGNSDGDLEDDEDTILSSTTICNGLDGTNGYNTIISTQTEDPGDNCPNGGVEFTVGLDTNNNNAIDAGEEVGTYYVCNGADGSAGKNSIISVTTFSGTQNGCTDGGLRIQTGIDDNGDGILQAGEVDATAYVCNGNDGSDGNSDGVFEFYFQEGFDGYTGVVDLSITDKNGNEVGETLSVDRLATDSHGLLYFPDIDRMQETIGTDQFEIVEAILYLKGKSVRIDGENTDNYIGVKTFLPEAPLFKEAAVTWNSADGATSWTVSGGTSNDNDGDANGYSDMFRLPNTVTFTGYIPLLLNRSEVSQWKDKNNNKGMVLLMADDATGYELDIISSDNTKNETDRPTLYIKAKITSKSRSSTYSDKELKRQWNQKTYAEKLAPLKRKK
jgi:hypothetical protein